MRSSICHLLKQSGQQNMGMLTCIQLPIQHHCLKEGSPYQPQVILRGDNPICSHKKGTLVKQETLIDVTFPIALCQAMPVLYLHQGCSQSGAEPFHEDTCWPTTPPAPQPCCSHSPGTEGQHPAWSGKSQTERSKMQMFPSALDIHTSYVGNGRNRHFQVPHPSENA